MAEVVDSFSERVAAEALIGGNLRHDEVGLGKLCARRIHSNENIRYCLDVEVLCEFNQAHMVVDDLPKLLQNLPNLLSVGPWVLGNVGVGQIY